MKVVVKDFSVNMELKNNGMELQVHGNDDKHLGDLIVNKTRLEWCDGRTRAGNGVQISWKDFIAYANELKDAQAAKKAAPAAKKAAAKKAPPKVAVKK
ncbi:hypothetical protein [Pandoraea cepalis]|uniref:hypothetical protein n=1 Tax=Pandoraea cepalis TaxID=2508294 RepID=UPI00263B76FB|nr:hypothetical protein [Pandoraea cepalis]